MSYGETFAGELRRRHGRMSLPHIGHMGVDGRRGALRRLREERLERIKAEARGVRHGWRLLGFDMTTSDYVTATHIGTWEQDKLTALPAAREDEPIM